MTTWMMMRKDSQENVRKKERQLRMITLIMKKRLFKKTEHPKKKRKA